MIDGIEYIANIDKTVNIDFSAATYKAELIVWENPYEESIKLIPDNMDFLYEVTDIFPLSDYDITIHQSAPYNRRNKEDNVSISLLIDNKQTGERVYLAESSTLSDRDYEYIRDILIRDIPQYTWITAEQHIRSDIEQCLGENSIDLFSDGAWEIFTKMVSARYKEIKKGDLVDFSWDEMESLAREVLEDALSYAFHAEGYEGSDS